MIYEIQRLIINEKYRKQLGIEGKKEAISKYNWKYINNKYYTNEMKEIYNFWENVGLQKHSEKTLIRNIKKKHHDVIKDIDNLEITQAIYNIIS